MKFATALRSTGPSYPMTSVKSVVSKFAREAVRLDMVTAVLCHVQKQPRILMLHAVGGPSYPAGLFRAHLKFLSKFFRIVPLDQVWNPADQGRDQRPKVALTFDDGLRNNLTVAYPLLREFQAPATFFVCPGLIDAGRWLWNHECFARLESMGGRQTQFMFECGLDSSGVGPFLQELKYLPYAERIVIEKKLRDVTPDFLPTAQQHEQFDLMTWDELRSLDPALVAIGGHSNHHEILSRLDSGRLEAEVADCASRLMQELGRPAPHFCYPDGSYNQATLQAVGRHFHSAVTINEGFVPVSPNLLELPRISIPANLQDLIWRMQRPSG